MKRMLILGIIILFSLTSLALALSIDGAQTQGKGKFGLSLEQEFIFDKDLERNYKEFERDWYLPGLATLNIDYLEKPTTSEIDKMQSTLLRVSYGVLDNLDIYFKIGTLDAQIRESYGGHLYSPLLGTLYGGGRGKAEFEGANFIYGAGLKGSHDLKNGWLIGCDAQYLRYDADYIISNIFRGQVPILGGGTAQESWHGDITVQQWHVAPYIGKHIGNFTPYLGVRYSDLRMVEKSRPDADNSILGVATLNRAEDVSGSGYKIKYKAEDNFGIFFGTDYKVSDDFKMNFEVHLLDEYGLAFAGTYKFINNPLEPVSIQDEVKKNSKICLALEQNFIFNKDLKKETWDLSRNFIVSGVPLGTLLYHFTPTTLEVDNLNYTLFKLGYDIVNNLQVFLKAGTVDGGIRESYNGRWFISTTGIEADIGGNIKHELEGPVFAYGAGISGKHDFNNGWFVGADAEYLRHTSDYTAENSYTLTSDNGLVNSMYCYESWRGSLTFEQWHFASYIGKKILKASPYLGVRYSDMHIQDKSRAGALLLLDILALDVVNSTSDYKRKLKADNNFGVFVGTDYNITKNFKLNLETHFIDEYSLKFGGTFNF